MAVTSGGGQGVAIASIVAITVGGSARALTVWLVDKSWMIAALAFLITIFIFYAWGAYRVWDETEHRTQEAEQARADNEEALMAARARPSGPVGVMINGGDNNQAWDNKINFYPSTHAEVERKQSGGELDTHS